MTMVKGRVWEGCVPPHVQSAEVCYSLHYSQWRIQGLERGVSCACAQ